MTRLLTRTALAAALLALAACEPAVSLHGNLPEDERLAEIKIGRFTKSDVLAILGSPSSKPLFSDDHWYYISAKIETYAFFKPEEVERHVIDLTFDKNNVVQSIKTLTLADGQEVQLATRETPAPGKELGLLEQLIGNVGKFSGTNKDRASGP